MNQSNSVDTSNFRRLVVNEAKRNDRFRSDVTVTLKIDGETVENINGKLNELSATPLDY